MSSIALHGRACHEPENPERSQQRFIEAQRITRNPLASLERRCLVWLAHRLPSRVNSDHLTVLALFAMLGAGASYAVSLVNRWSLGLVVVCLAINWFGDSLDGTVARVRGHQRPRYGFYVDHIVDSFGVLFLLGGLALSGNMSPFIAMGVVLAYFLLSIEIFLATYCLAAFKMSFWGCGPTELRILLAVGTLAIWRDPAAEILGRRYLLFDVGGAVAIIGLLATVVFSVARNARALYRTEPVRAVEVR